MKKSINIDSGSLSINKSAVSKQKSKSPTMKTSQLNPWTTQTKTSETKYCKNLDNIAKSLIQKMKNSTVCPATAGRNREKNDLEQSLDKEEPDLREESARDSGKLSKTKSSKNTKRKIKGNLMKLYK